MNLPQVLACDLEASPTRSSSPEAVSEESASLLPASPTLIGALLTPSDAGVGVVRQQLLLGTAGLLALGLASHAAVADLLKGESRAFLLQPLALPVGAALGVSLGLPGLFILLTVLGQCIPPRFGLRATSRAYFILGAISAAATPVLLLFDHTGGSSGMTVVGMGLTYLVGGGWALVGLAWTLWRTLERRSVRSFALLGGWVTYTTVLSGYLWLKLNFLLWS